MGNWPLMVGVLFLVLFQIGSIKSIRANSDINTIKLDPTPTTKAFKFPEMIILKVRLQGLHPISRASVWADVQGPAGDNQRLWFRETGGTSPYDVLYSAAVPPPVVDGIYGITVFANDNQGQAQFVIGFESEPRPGTETTSAQRDLPPFEIWHAFEIKLEGYNAKQDLRPLKIRDLYAEKHEKGCYRLFWTAPLGISPNDQYEIRASQKSFCSQRTWREASIVIKEHYTVKGGEPQHEVVCLPAKGRYYLAARSLSTTGLASEISNDYIVVIK